MPRRAARGRAIHQSLDMNRITRYLEESAEHCGDFYVVAGEFGRVSVTHAVAHRIQAVLDRWIVPTWIVFPDRVGSIVRVRTRHIRALVESTVEQRAADRRLDRAREEEEKADRRPWDDD